MSQNLPMQSLRDFLVYVNLTISYLRARKIENVITTSRFLAAPVQANRDFFPGILTLYFNCMYFPLYTRELLVSASSEFRLQGEIPERAIIVNPYIYILYDVIPYYVFNQTYLSTS